MKIVNTLQSSLLLTGLFLGSSLSAQFTTVFDDSGDFDAGNYFFNRGGGGTPELTGGTTLVGKFADPGGRTGINRVFDTVTLGVGGSIRLQFSTTLTNTFAQPAQANGLRFALSSNNSATLITAANAGSVTVGATTGTNNIDKPFGYQYSGITTSIGVGGTQSGGWGLNNMSDGEGEFDGTRPLEDLIEGSHVAQQLSQNGAFANTYSFAYDTEIAFAMEIMRDSSTSVVLTLFADGNSLGTVNITGLDPDIIDDFNTLTIGLNGQAANQGDPISPFGTGGNPLLTFSSLSVTTAVPEPSTYAILLGAFSMALMLIKRRRVNK